MCKEGQYHIKPTPPMYFLHNLHARLSGFHALIFYLKADRISYFIWERIPYYRFIYRL